MAVSLLSVTNTEVRTVGRLAAPLLAGLFFSLLVAPVVENAFASMTGVGGVSALAYSRNGTIVFRDLGRNLLDVSR